MLLNLEVLRPGVLRNRVPKATLLQLLHLELRQEVLSAQ